MLENVILKLRVWMLQLDQKNETFKCFIVAMSLPQYTGIEQNYCDSVTFFVVFPELFFRTYYFELYSP